MRPINLFTWIAFTAVLTLTSAANADVTLTFDSTTQGFALDGGAPTGSTVSWESVDGDGKLKLTAPGGWAGSMSKLDATAAGTTWGLLSPEINTALTNGGTISFDVLVRRDDQTLVGDQSPNWFQVVLISQGEFSGYDSETLSFDLWDSQWETGGQLENPGSSFTANVSVPLVSGVVSAGGNGEAQFNLSDTWRNFHLGLNNDGTGVSNAVVYLDNFTISANAVPEPTGLGFLALTGVVIASRRRR
ncbi:hypothetical protein CA13_29980 [Planctomycetes bacterium CA13]|uniref:PEP-CTERM protein-sorting domain-containing protein n=1 Tax=Novipirellula herctigrandis TaxID=2527986 RepID=A0A5C5Z2Y4_9BACT|nr:hypothetical protein CA13_29980 [Planctomycetes bacterium CA13]